MQLAIEEARRLVETAMMGVGHDAADARTISDHLIDCELRGLPYGGVGRAISIVERMRRVGDRRQPIAVQRETPVSAQIDGGDHVGYVVASRATRTAIAKARDSGIAIVGANNTWYTGMLSYYAEMAAADGLVTMIASNATPWVAHHGSSEACFGTNPICFGFPGDEHPVIWDIGTGAIMHGEAMLKSRLGEPLPPGVAYDRDGNPTTDPAAALSGAFVAWGGHKGAGLGLVVQLLGVLAGSPIMPPDLSEFGFLIVAIDPELLMPAETYKSRVAAYAAKVRAARPAQDGSPVRMPFDRSVQERRRRLAGGVIDVPDAVYEQLSRL